MVSLWPCCSTLNPTTLSLMKERVGGCSHKINCFLPQNTRITSWKTKLVEQGKKIPIDSQRKKTVHLSRNAKHKFPLTHLWTIGGDKPWGLTLTRLGGGIGAVLPVVAVVSFFAVAAACTVAYCLTLWRIQCPVLLLASNKPLLLPDSTLLCSNQNPHKPKDPPLSIRYTTIKHTSFLCINHLYNKQPTNYTRKKATRSINP